MQWFRSTIRGDAPKAIALMTVTTAVRARKGFFSASLDLLVIHLKWYCIVLEEERLFQCMNSYLNSPLGCFDRVKLSSKCMHWCNKTHSIGTGTYGRQTLLLFGAFLQANKTVYLASNLGFSERARCSCIDYIVWCSFRSVFAHACKPTTPSPVHPTHRYWH